MGRLKGGGSGGGGKDGGKRTREHHEAELPQEAEDALPSRGPRRPSVKARPRWPLPDELWKDQLKREIMEEVKAQMKGLSREIVTELRQFQAPPMHNQPTSPWTNPRRTPYNDRDERVEDGVVEVALVNFAEAQMNVERPPGVVDLSERADLSEPQQEQLRALLAKWGKVFAQHEEDFGRANIVQHRIPTGNADPVRERYRPVPPLLYKEVKSLLSGMLQQGVIREL
uniref:Uncharacterized protein n=1 Tax=Knipowitschia caucasica TaxID=637954 RepID=A0AAV2LI35_KNICA